MIEKVTDFIKKNNIIKQNDIIIVGLSGGPDSVCLLDILWKLKDKFKIKLVAAHLDHQWRATSQDDVLFCKELAEALNIPFEYQRANQIKLKKKPCGTSQEALGRLLRRQFFEEMLKKYKANSIALAHHWDDQIETFFIRLIRGASISGLSSIRPKHGLYIRPLLDIKKSEILEYLKLSGLKYIQDPTNKLDIYLRNKIRNNLIPVLNDIDPRFDKKFRSTIQNIQETDQFLEDYTKNILKNITVKKDDLEWIDKEKLLTIDKYLYPRILVQWLCKHDIQFTPSKSFFDEIVRFIKQPGSSIHSIKPDWSIEKRKNLIRLINN